MEMHLEKDGDRLCVQLEGRLDTTTAPELKAVLDKELEGINKLVFDLEALEYMSSAGLAVFTKMIIVMKLRGSVLTVCNANDRVVMGFKIVGMIKDIELK